MELARLEEGQTDGTGFLALEPVNPRACELTVYLDYPTLVMSEGTTEMFGPEERRLEELELLVVAVIAGRYEWTFGTSRFLGLFRARCLRGTFRTARGPWRFRHCGAIDPPAAQHGKYEPY